MNTPIAPSDKQFEPSDQQIEERARQLCSEDGLDPDAPMREGWDDVRHGPQWTGYAEQAKQELISENLFAK